MARKVKLLNGRLEDGREFNGKEHLLFMLKNPGETLNSKVPLDFAIKSALVANQLKASKNGVVILEEDDWEHLNKCCQAQTLARIDDILLELCDGIKNAEKVEIAENKKSAGK
jgi:hypothetical protein